MSETNFDQFLVDLHDLVDRIREITDVDEQSSAIVGDLAQAYTEHPSTMQTTMCLSALFAGQKNLLQYLRRVSSKNELKKSKLELLQFLKFFVETASTKILPYAVDLKSVLLTIFHVDNASDVRAAVFPILTQLMELSVGSANMQNEIDKMAQMFLDQIGLQSSKATATIKGLCLAFLGLLCKVYPEHMKKYADRLLSQYLKYLHEQLVKDVVKFEMLIAAGAIEGLTNFLVHFPPSAISTNPPVVVSRGKTKDEEKRLNEERIRSESDLKRVYLYAARSIQTQDQTNLNRYALVRAGLELFAQHSTLFTDYLYEDYPEILRCLRAWNVHDNYEVKKVAQRAFDTFLLGIANALKEANVKTPEERKRAQQTFQFFIREFREKIDSPELEIKDLAMGIRGYGIFANACKLYGTDEDIKFMFVGLIQRCEQIAMPTVNLSQAAQIFDERFYGLPNLIEALSAIIVEMNQIGEEFLGPLERLTVMTIDYYPRYQPKSQTTTTTAVIKMILALQNKPQCYKSFLTRIVTQALIRCCSHPLKSLVEQQNEDYEINSKSLLSIGKTITYENYLPLWKSILTVTSMKEFDTPAFPIFERQNMLVSFYDEMIDCVLHIIDRLDLNVEKEESEVATSDPVFGLKPVKEKDFQIFYNLVDFCRDLLLDQSPQLFEKWVFRFLYDVISASTRFPLVSGLYRLATLIIQICYKLNYFKDPFATSSSLPMEIDSEQHEQISAVSTLIRRFSHEVLARQKQFQDDLLVSCLQLIIALPAECFDDDFVEFLPAIQLALTIGLTYLPLAEQTVTSFDRWSRSSTLKFEQFYDEILPFLDDFLRLSSDQLNDVNIRTIVSALQERTRTKSKSQNVLPTRMMKKTKQIRHLFEETEIRRVQQRIFLFLGSIGNGFNWKILGNDKNFFLKEALAWDNENHLTFPLPFDDIKPNLHLDLFLPRIVDLALRSSDRQAKITACELLHSIVLFLIGKSAHHRTNSTISFDQLYKNLFPVLVELSCDSDTFTKSLFSTFVFQIIHWLTKIQTSETFLLLNTLIDGVMTGRNASIRDFSAVSLKEFLQWTVKHGGGFDQNEFLKISTSILKRILSFASHPNSFKRLGSALAFNSIYTLFRESEQLIDIYTLQLLFVFVESLAMAQNDDPSLGTRIQTISSLSHLQRILKEKSTIFLKETTKRIRPPSWTEASLDVTIRWLLRQCGRIETEARRKSIELVCVLIPLLPGVRTIREYFQNKIQTDGFKYFIERFEGTMNKDKKGRFKANLATQPCLTDITEPFSLSIVHQWLDTLIASLDCYTWVFSQGFLNPLIFDDAKQQSRFLLAIRFFISNVSLKNLHEICPKSNEILTPNDVRQFDTAKCTVIVRLFNFFTAIWTKFPQETLKTIDSTFYSDEFLRLIFICVLNPQELGFDSNDEEIHEKLPEQLRQLLKILTKNLPESLLKVFQRFSIDLTRRTGRFDLFLALESTPVHWPFVLTLSRAFRLLFDVNLLSKSSFSSVDVENLWNLLIKKLISFENAEMSKSNFVLTLENQRSFQSVFELIVELGICPRKLLRYFVNSQRLHTDSGLTTIGNYFVQIFKNQLTNLFVSSPNFLWKSFEEISSRDECRSIVSFLIVVLDVSTREKTFRQRSGRQLIDGIYTFWSQFVLLYRSENLDDKLLIVTLLTKTFLIDSRLIISHDNFDLICQIYLNYLVDRQIPLAFKTRLLDLLPFFASLENDVELSVEKREKFQRNFEKTLENFTSNSFPLRSDEFPVGSRQFDEFRDALRKILSALEFSSSSFIFEFAVWILSCETQHRFQDEILDAISRHVEHFSVEKLENFTKILYGEKENFRFEQRQNVAEKILSTILTSMKKTTLNEFFTKNLEKIIFEQLENSTDLINKIVAFRFLDLMFAILSKDELFGLNSSIAKRFFNLTKETRRLETSLIKIGPNFDGKELTKYVIAKSRAQTIDSKPFRTNVDQNEKINILNRSVAISAFNCLISVLICTQTEAKLYKAFLFDANSSKDEFIFEHIVDPNVTYKFPLELERFYRKDQRNLTKILSKKLRQTTTNSTRTTTPKYLPTQFLFGSSLTDELAVFDFTTAVATQQQQQQQIELVDQSETIDEEIDEDFQMEIDELNLHPSMLPMVCLLKHLDQNGISPSSSTNEMPPWMICLYKKFHDTSVYLNIKLFIMRLITHTHRLFRPHARFWLTPILQLCNEIFEKSSEGLNTFIIDTLVVVLSWHSVAIPSESDSNILQKLIEFLFLNCKHSNSIVMKSNFDLIRKLVELWKNRIIAPTSILYKFISDADIKSKENSLGLNLLGIVLANEILPFRPSNDNDLTEDKFNETLVKNMKNSFRIIYAAAAEVVGMLLKVKKQQNQSIDRLLEQLNYLLRFHSSQTVLDTYVTCIYSIEKHFPPIVDKSVMNKLIFSLKKFHGDLKIECLNAMISNVKQFESIFLDLRAAGIFDVLHHKDFSIRTVALKLIYQLLTTLSFEQLNEIAENLSIDGPIECQNWTLEIYKWMYDYLTSTLTDENRSKTTTNDVFDSFFHHVRQQLLKFLSSNNEFLRVNCRNFWADPHRISIASQHRLIALIDQLYSSKSENTYLHYSTNFLLERTSHNPDYSRTIFEHPLDQCEFREFQLNSNWRQRHQSYTTPLFTLQSQSQISLNDPSNHRSILQTQEIAARQQFLPTQQIIDEKSKNYNWLKQTDTFDPSTQMTLIVGVDRTKKVNRDKVDKDEDDDVFRLKRRFLKDSGKLHSYFARQQNEKKQKEKRFLDDVKSKDENQVEKYRTYRIGELPDIEIRYSDIIIPLQALAQSDHQIARELFSSLFTSMLNSLEDLLTSDEFNDLIRTIQQGFHRILSQSEIFYPSFIGAIFDIFLSKSSNRFDIPPAFLSTAAMASQLESLGILTLESSIRSSIRMIQDQLDGLDGPTKKKLKSSTTDEKKQKEKIDVWLELAKCSRSIGDYDDVRGIFSHLTQLKPITLKAIEEESQSDFLSALNSYVTALEQYRLSDDESSNDPIFELEHEFWTQSMLKCCDQLSNWKIMSKHIFLESVTFDSLWSDVEHLKTLMPFAIRSKLKLLITGSEQEQLEQEDLCQFFTHLSSSSSSTTSGGNTDQSSQLKRSFLEKQYPFELATFFLYQKDFDRSKYFLHLAKEQFFQHWSTLSRLNDSTRQRNLETIQPLNELDTFLQFIELHLPLIKSLENRYSTNNVDDQLSSDMFFERFHHDLVSQWRLPDPNRNSIQIWDDIVTNRSLFLDVIDDLLGGPRQSFASRLKSKEFDPILIDLKTQLSLDIADCALEQRNFKLALTKLNETRSRLDQCENATLKSIHWHEIYCDVHLRRHQTSPLPHLLSTLVAKELKKLEPKIQSIKIIDRSTAKLHSRYLQLNALFCRTVIDDLLIDPQVYRLYEEDAQISTAKHRQIEFYLDHPIRDLKETHNLLEELFKKEIQLLRGNLLQHENETTTTTLSKQDPLLCQNYNALVQFCDSFLRRYENQEDPLLDHLFAHQYDHEIADLVVQSILASMKYGSNEGVKRFSRLLQIVQLYPKTLQSISAHLQEIPCWMFFDCLYQITAHLDKPIAHHLHPMIDEMIKTYPQALIYPFKLSYETFQNTVTDPTLKRYLESVRHKLDRQVPLVNEFIQALYQLNPQQQFESWSKEFFQLLGNDPSTRNPTKLRQHLTQFKEILFSDLVQVDETSTEDLQPSSTITSQDSVFGDGTDRRPLKPRTTSIRFQFKNMAEKDLDQLFGSAGEHILTVPLVEAKTVVNNLKEKLKKVTQEKTNLHDYSTWFSTTFRQQHRIISSISNRELEIPGQYTSDKKPLLDHHIKIVGFDEKLLILHSLRLPKRIIIRGHDEKDYRFLIKAGEDLRQDQRIQALFHLMNDLYQHPSHSILSTTVRTYQVIPMSSKLGMIEWLDHTCPLKELIERSYTPAEQTILSQGQDPRKLYQDYVTLNFQKSKPTVKTMSNTVLYAELFLTLQKYQVEEHFSRIQSLVPADLLRRAYYRMANSHEGFYSLRRQFILSYALLCISHYILGIGDRHQSNFLIDTSTGQVIGIDFGSAFNAATIHLPVPELFPIRLTRQLVELMSPIGTAGLFRATMIQTMTILRENSDLLLSTMDVFIKEPLLEWTEHALKTSRQASAIELSSARSEETYAKDRVKSARLKLNGINPAVITAADLKLNAFFRPASMREALRQMEKVVGGDQDVNKRAQYFVKYDSNRSYRLSVDEQIDCLIDQATDVDILGRSWIGLETFM